MRDADGPLLQRLDDRVVPHLRGGARRVARAAAAPFRAANRAEERLAGGVAFRALWPRRQFIVLAAAALLFIGGFVHMQRFEAAWGDGPAAVGATDADDDPVADDPGAGAGADTVGPALGDAIEDHVAEREAALDGADGDEQRFAVVSLAEYRPVDAVAEIVTVPVVEVLLRVPSEGEDPFRVTIDDDEDLTAAVTAALERERDRVADEEHEFRRLLDSGTISDAEFERFYEAEVERLAAVRNLLAVGSGTIFAVVVLATVDELRELSVHDGVRLVDPAPADVEASDDVTFYGLLPDDSSTASFGSLG